MHGVSISNRKKREKSNPTALNLKQVLATPCFMIREYLTYSVVKSIMEVLKMNHTTEHNPCRNPPTEVTLV